MGQFSLPSQAYNLNSTEQTLAGQRLADTESEDRERDPLPVSARERTSIARSALRLAIQVQGAFTSGGSTARRRSHHSE